jgi:hypothetical protein
MSAVRLGLNTRQTWESENQAGAAVGQKSPHPNDGRTELSNRV